MFVGYTRPAVGENDPPPTDWELSPRHHLDEKTRWAPLVTRCGEEVPAPAAYISVPSHVCSWAMAQRPAPFHVLPFVRDNPCVNASTPRRFDQVAEVSPVNVVVTHNLFSSTVGAGSS